MYMQNLKQISGFFFFGHVVVTELVLLSLSRCQGITKVLRVTNLSI